MSKDPSTNKIESDEKKYFFITPRVVKALTTSPYEDSLWGTIKDICGEAGECYISTPDLALLSNMSTGAVSKHRKGLIEKGILKGEIKKDPGYPQPVWHLTIPDLWAVNIEFVLQHPTIAARVAHKQAQKDSLHQVKTSPDERGTPPDERGTPPDETKKKEKKKEKKNPPRPKARVKGEPKNPYLNPLGKNGQPKSEYVTRSEALEVWFMRCRMGGTWMEMPLSALVGFLPDWSKGGAGLMKTWRNPLNALYKKCGENFELTKLVILEACRVLNARNLTYSQPIHIQKTTDSIALDVIAGKTILIDVVDDQDDEIDEVIEETEETPKITIDQIESLRGGRK